MPRFFNTTTALWTLRQILQFGGAWLSFNGYTDQAGAEHAIDQIYALVGPASFIIGFAANIYASFRAKGVANGQAVSMDKLSGSVKAEVKAAIERKPTLLERLGFGK